MSLPYLTLSTFKVRTLMAPMEVDYVEQDSPGFVEARIAIRTSWIHQRLRKRYGNTMPFGSAVPGQDVPEIILGWLTAMVTWEVLRRRGVNPQDPGVQTFLDDFTTAEAECKEAADSETGLFDLPITETATSDGGSGVSTGGPLGYSEQSPYVWMSKQRAAGAREDGNSDE